MMDSDTTIPKANDPFEISLNMVIALQSFKSIVDESIYKGFDIAIIYIDWYQRVRLC